MLGIHIYHSKTVWKALVGRGNYWPFPTPLWSQSVDSLWGREVVQFYFVLPYVHTLPLLELFTAASAQRPPLWLGTRHCFETPEALKASRLETRRSAIVMELPNRACHLARFDFLCALLVTNRDSTYISYLHQSFQPPCVHVRSDSRRIHSD